MPEGDTGWLTARRLNRALAGRTLTLFDLRVPQLTTADLRGSAVTAVVARGKHLLTRFDSGLSLHSHLRMDGSWYVTEAGRRASGHPGHQCLRCSTSIQRAAQGPPPRERNTYWCPASARARRRLSPRAGTVQADWACGACADGGAATAVATGAPGSPASTMATSAAIELGPAGETR